jgi:serine/threonine protein phosphatase PrpC
MKNKVGEQSEINLFGVFDGHGGSFAAQFVAERLEKAICQHQSWRDNEVRRSLLLAHNCSR